MDIMGKAYLLWIDIVIMYLSIFKKLYGPFFMDGVQLSQDHRATTRRQFNFYH